MVFYRAKARPLLSDYTLCSNGCGCYLLYLFSIPLTWYILFFFVSQLSSRYFLTSWHSWFFFAFQVFGCFSLFFFRFFTCAMMWFYSFFMKNNITAANSARFFPLIHTHRRSEFMLRTIHFFYLVPLSGESDSLFVRLREWDKCDGNTRNKKNKTWPDERRQNYKIELWRKRTL